MIRRWSHLKVGIYDELSEAVHKYFEIFYFGANVVPKPTPNLTTHYASDSTMERTTGATQPPTQPATTPVSTTSVPTTSAPTATASTTRSPTPPRPRITETPQTSPPVPPSPQSIDNVSKVNLEIGVGSSECILIESFH